MHPGTFWWGWIPEVLAGLQTTICCSHGHTPFFLLYKQEPFIVERPIEPDMRYPIKWDIDLAVESDLIDQLCAMFKSIRLSCADCLRAADLKFKVYYKHMTQLLEVEFA